MDRLEPGEVEALRYKALYEDEKARADGLARQLALLMGQAAKAPAPRSSIAPELERNAFAEVLAQSSLKQRAYFVALVMGHSYEQIATATGVAQTTVLLQVQKVLLRLGVSGNLKGLRERAEEYRHHLAQEGVQEAIGVKADWLIKQDPAFIAGLLPVMKCMPPPAPKKRAALPPL